ncbi:MAG: adenosine deaminase [candidate division Zixibacteria bacterium]|nr:adenosine deaminase [candidate division Zixibacteria bacterium]
MLLSEYIRAVPKTELHVHLEGSIQPATLLTLARRHGVLLPADDVAGLREWFRYRDFHHFIEIYVAITKCLRTTEDFELIVHEFGAEMARQNVRYAEVTFSPSNHRWINGVDADVYMTGLTAGRIRVLADFGVEIAWVFDLVRNSPDPARLDYTTSVAIEGRESRVVAIGLGGLETGYPPEDYAPWFDRARAAGLRSDPHAGEHEGPASIWGAIRALGAERIGHGVRAAEDPELMAYLAEHNLPIETNPTSNICLGVYPAMTQHPIPRLYAAGVPLTVNSDDPPLFNTTLTDELCLLADPFGFDRETIDRIMLNGVRHSFLPDDRKQGLEAVFLAEMAALALR